MLNGLLASLALHSALGAFIFWPKFTEKTVEQSPIVKMTDDAPPKTVSAGILIDGKTYPKIELTSQELMLAKFIYSQVKEYEKSNFGFLNNEIRSIARTIATRFIECNESTTIEGLLSKIAQVDYQSYEFKINDKLTYSVAKNVKLLTENPEAMKWTDSSMIFYSKRDWQPDNKTYRDFTFEAKSTSPHFVFWSVKPVKLPEINLNKLSDDEKFLARVIYSETSTICTPFEVKLVCKVIMNRIRNREFGNAKNAAAVVKVKNAFSCINDSSNSNWNEFKPNLNYETKRACIYSYYMMRGDQASIELPSGYDDIVYYHDKSIKCPENWTTKNWEPELVVETDHFKFYRIKSKK